MARGIKNNNPMNLRKTAIKWDGKIVGTDKIFETFKDTEHGIRAGAKVLINYQEKYNLNTINEIMNRYAPSSENDTQSYIKHIAESLGVGVDEPINIKDNLFTLVKTIIKHENGINPYPDNIIHDGLAMV